MDYNPKRATLEKSFQREALMTKRRTEITVETERLLVRHSRRTTRVLCARCGAEIEAAAGLTDETPDAPAPGDAPVAEKPEEDSRRS